MKIRQTFICEPLRTPVGRFGGAYKNVDAQFLGAAVLRGLLEKSELPAAAVEDVLFAQCYSSMEAPALGRVVALDAGLPVTTGGLPIQQHRATPCTPGSRGAVGQPEPVVDAPPLRLNPDGQHKLPLGLCPERHFKMRETLLHLCCC